MSSEQLEGQILILLALLGCQRLEPLKLDEGLRTVSPTTIEHARYDHNTVNLSRRELLFVLDQPHRSLHRGVVLLLVKLPLTEQKEVNGLGTLPRIGQSFVRRGSYITGNQRIHSLGGHVGCCLSCACYLGDLSIEDPLLVRVDFEGCKHINLLNQEQRSILLSQLLSYLSK